MGHEPSGFDKIVTIININSDKDLRFYTRLKHLLLIMSGVEIFIVILAIAVAIYYFVFTDRCNEHSDCEDDDKCKIKMCVKKTDLSQQQVCKVFLDNLSKYNVNSTMRTNEECVNDKPFKSDICKIRGYEKLKSVLDISITEAHKKEFINNVIKDSNGNCF